LGFEGRDWALLDLGTAKAAVRFPNASKGDRDAFGASPDGKCIALVSTSGRLKAFDTTFGKQLAEMQSGPAWSPGSSRPQVAFSPVGSVVYVLGWQESTVHRCDLRAGKVLPPIRDLPLTALLPHPDGKRLLAIGIDGVLRHYDLATGNRLLKPELFEGIMSAVPSPDGRLVAAVSGWRFHQLDVFDSSGRHLWTSGLRGPDCAPCWSRDGRKMAVIDGSEIRLVEPRSGKVVRVLSAPEDVGRFDFVARFSADGSRVIVSGDSGLRHLEFDVATGNPSKVIECDKASARGFSPDGRMALYASEEEGIRLFDRAAGKFITDWIDPPKAEDRCRDVPPGFTPDGSYLLTWELEPQREAWRPRSANIVLRDPYTGARRGFHQLNLSTEFQWAVSPNGLWLAIGTESGTVDLFDLTTGHSLGRWGRHRDGITTIHFAGLGRVLSSSGDQTALLWNLRPRTGPKGPAWDSLQERDGTEVWRAVWALEAEPQAPNLLRAKINSAIPPASDRVTQWLIDLGSDQFGAREVATKELQALGRLVETDLRAARKKASSEEVRTRLDALLSKITPERTPAELVQARAVAAMELAGTPAAKKLLAEWAAGALGARLTIDAKAALSRLGATR
jgi:WD40 repeat protein